MSRPILGAIAFLLAAAPTYCQTTPIGIVNGTHFEDFNGMGTGTPSYPPGWNGFKLAGSGSLPVGSFITSGTSPAFTTSDGSGVILSGTVYNFGTAGNSDRALGTIASGTTHAGFGVVLVNDTGRVLTSADIQFSFRAEQWRTGTNAVVKEWVFQWATGGGTLDVNNTSMTFQTETAFNINEILTGSTTAVASDGNVNFVNIGPAAISAFTWNPGDRLVLRWLDADNPGTDAGMAIDNFSFTVFAPVPEPAVLAMVGFGAAALLWLRRTEAA